MKRNILVAFLCLSSLFSVSQKHSFEIKDGQFLLDHQPFQIRAGEMHYARVPQQYWRQRLMMIKAMGLNTVCTYVFWNYHHPSPNKWNFTTDNHNIKVFLSLAKELGLYVILRPGPYACAEWDFGGYPWWLSTVKGLEIRTDNQSYLDSCKIYFQKLAEQVKGFHITDGGPIILTQIENEFGSYVVQRKDIPLAQHLSYTAKIKDILIASGFKEPFYTSDGRTLFKGGHVKDVFPAANGEDNIDSLKVTVNKFNHGEGPYFVAEFYPGWLDHWAEPFVKVTTEEIIKQTEKYLENEISFSYYMVHGGTNFGYTSGANYTKAHPIQPDITSYDYDAPISEAGWATEKYKAIRKLMQEYTATALPDIPQHAPVLKLPDLYVEKTINFFEWIKKGKPVIASTPLSFEALHQNNGYVLYSVIIKDSVNGKFSIDGLRDYATVYVNGAKVGSLNRYYNQLELNDVHIPNNARLDILVESMGRINYGAKIIESLKGVLTPVLINGNELKGQWKMYTAPLENMPDFSTYSTAMVHKGIPAFYVSSFQINHIGDVFINVENWGKGIVFVNGHHLGRFWNVGPQQTLYLPGCWLKKGKNSIIIFDQNNDIIQNKIITSTFPILDKLPNTEKQF